MEPQLPNVVPTNKIFFHYIVLVYHMNTRVQQAHVVYHHYGKEIKEISSNEHQMVGKHEKARCSVVQKQKDMFRVQ